MNANRVRIAHTVLLLKVWILVKKPGWNWAVDACARRGGWSRKLWIVEDQPPNA